MTVLEAALALGAAALLLLAAIGLWRASNRSDRGGGM